MKKLNVLLTVIIALTLTSCKKDIEDRIVGEWNYNWSITERSTASAVGISASANSTIQNDTGIITFNADGTGSGNNTDGDSYSIEWNSVGKETVTITIKSDGYDPYTQKFEVLKNKKHEQHWENVSSTLASATTNAGNTSASVEYITEWKLSN